MRVGLRQQRVCVQAVCDREHGDANVCSHGDANSSADAVAQPRAEFDANFISIACPLLESFSFSIACSKPASFSTTQFIAFIYSHSFAVPCSFLNSFTDSNPISFTRANVYTFFRTLVFSLSSTIFASIASSFACTIVEPDSIAFKIAINKAFSGSFSSTIPNPKSEPYFTSFAYSYSLPVSSSIPFPDANSTSFELPNRHSNGSTFTCSNCPSLHDSDGDSDFVRVPNIS